MENKVWQFFWNWTFLKCPFLKYNYKYKIFSKNTPIFGFLPLSSQKQKNTKNYSNHK
jgi:hypothetical protein